MKEYTEYDSAGHPHKVRESEPVASPQATRPLCKHGIEGCALCTAVNYNYDAAQPAAGTMCNAHHEEFVAGCRDCEREGEGTTPQAERPKRGDCTRLSSECFYRGPHSIDSLRCTAQPCRCGQGNGVCVVHPKPLWPRSLGEKRCPTCDELTVCGDEYHARAVAPVETPPDISSKALEACRVGSELADLGHSAGRWDNRFVAAIASELLAAREKLAEFGIEWDGEKYVFNGKTKTAQTRLTAEQFLHDWKVANLYGEYPQLSRLSTPQVRQVMEAFRDKSEAPLLERIEQLMDAVAELNSFDVPKALVDERMANAGLREEIERLNKAFDLKQLIAEQYATSYARLQREMEALQVVLPDTLGRSMAVRIEGLLQRANREAALAVELRQRAEAAEAEVAALKRNYAHLDFLYTDLEEHANDLKFEVAALRERERS